MARIFKGRIVKFSALVMCLQAAAVFGQAAAPASAPDKPDKPPLSNAEIEQLVAPIALYPDSLMTQILMASTYPLEVVQADRFVKANKDLKGDALTAKLEQLPWDASVKSLINFPTVLDMMDTKLDATTKLGDAFIEDQKRVLEAVQRLRSKAQAEGNLKTTEQQTIIVQQPGPTQVIQIQPANPQVIYVPTYNPTVVYGTWPYPAAPPYYYQPPGYFASAAIGFGVGVACGAAWGYAWGNSNWGGGDVDIDVNRNNNFNRNIDRSKYQNQINNRSGAGGAGAGATGGRGTWQHDPGHRGGVAYRDNATANKFGGQTPGQAQQARDQFRGRSDAGRQDLSRGGASDFRGPNAPTPGGGGLQNRAGGAGGAGNGGLQNRAGAGGAGNGGLQNRAGGAGASQLPARSGGGAGASQRPAGGAAQRPAGGAAQRPTASPRPSTGGGAFSGVSGGGRSASAASSRGAASRSGSVGGGRSAGGGGGGRRR